MRKLIEHRTSHSSWHRAPGSTRKRNEQPSHLQRAKRKADEHYCCVVQLLVAEGRQRQFLIPAEEDE
jgi:hypothetical protein